MRLELTQEQARLIKVLLKNEVDNTDLEEERKDELKAYLGDRKGEETHKKIYSELKQALNKFKNIEDINTENGYDMGLAQIVEKDIFSQIIEGD